MPKPKPRPRPKPPRPQQQAPWESQLQESRFRFDLLDLAAVAAMVFVAVVALQVIARFMG